MKFKLKIRLALVGFAMLATASLGAAQTNYSVQELPNLGGANALVSSVNNRGWATGAADFAGDNVSHAALWVGGTVQDLGSLAGFDSNVNSAIAWGVKANNGVLVGISDTAADNPLGGVARGARNPSIASQS